MDTAIRNVDDLRLEIARLQQVKAGQEEVIKQHFNSPRAILGTITSLFSRSKTNPANSGVIGHDLIGYLSKIFLPLTLNKTLFRKSGFVVKALVRLLSHKASHFINDKNAGSLWDKIKTILPDGIQEKIAPKKKSRISFLSSRNKRNNDVAQ